MLWTEKIIDKENNKQPIYSITFRPDGTQLLACCGSVILVYNTSNGELLETLKTHKDQVYAIDYNSDGKRFASGGADKTVIIWAANFEGLVRYSHSDAVQCLSHNPVNGQVLSCASSDFGLWSPEQKSVSKYKVSSRIVSCGWASGGQYFAIGMFNGTISIRNRHADELVKIERKEPIWSLAWSPAVDSEKLTVVDWDQNLAQYQANGEQILKDKGLTSDPNCVDMLPSGDLFVIGGSDGKVTLWTNENVKIGNVCDRGSWIWSCKVKPKSNVVAVGTNEGTLSLYQINFSTVHGLYQDIYAFRENMTDVVVQDLSKDHRYRIKCRDHVKKVAIFRHRLAIQLSDRILIYERSSTENSEEIQYVLKDKVIKKVDCNLLVVTTKNIVLCLEKRLQMLSIDGEMEREWVLDALIRYIKVIGGPEGKEGLLIGLKNGHILLIYLNNPLSVPLLSLNGSIRCLDLNQDRTKLAVVDEHGNCMAYNLTTREQLFKETGATSLAWNTEHDEMLCFSGNGNLYIKAGKLPTHSQKLNGFVVGFKGSKIFCLNAGAMVSVDVPQSASMDLYIQQKDFQRAYQIGCLGVTDYDWYKLAVQALEDSKLQVAKKSFIRIRDLKHLQLIKEFQLDQSPANPEVRLAEVLQHEGNHEDAAKLFKKGGEAQKATDIYTELKMWDKAAQGAEASRVNETEVLKKKVEEEETKQDFMAAAQTYVELGDFYQAAVVYGQNKHYEDLRNLARKISKLETRALFKCVEYLRESGEYSDLIVDILVKMGNIDELVNFYVQKEEWQDAFKIIELHPELIENVCLPYADWLIHHDKVEQALDNYKKAKRPELAIKVLKDMIEIATAENRFLDVSHSCWMLCQEFLSMVPNDKQELNALESENIGYYKRYLTMAELYYCYDAVYRYTTEPFIDLLPESLYQMSRFLLHASLWIPAQIWLGERFPSSLPPNIRLDVILFVLAKTASVVGAFSLEKMAYEKLLLSTVASKRLRKEVEIGYLNSRNNPQEDSEDIIPLCWNCGSANPLLYKRTDGSKDEKHSTFRIKCVNCEERFQPAFYSFESLALVEFEIDPSVSEYDAINILRGQLVNYSTKKDTANRSGQGNLKILNSDQLRGFKPNQIFIQNPGKKSMKARFYKEALPGVQITMCKSCEHFFHSEDFEYCLISKGGCPFCRVAPVDI